MVSMANTSITGPLPPANGTNTKLVTLDLTSTATLANATLPGSWGTQMTAMRCMRLQHTAMCGAVPPGLPCFSTTGTSLGARPPAGGTRSWGGHGGPPHSFASLWCMQLPKLGQVQHRRMPMPTDRMAHLPTPRPAGLSCANLTQEVWNSTLGIPVCHLDIPSSCPIADMLGGGGWSGGTSQFRALQLVRAAITNGSASAADPWTNRSPCNMTAAGATSLAGVTCTNDTIVGINASAVFACAGPHCTWSGHPWRPVREFADISTLQVLNLANMGMTGGRARARRRALVREAGSRLTCCAHALRRHAACRCTIGVSRVRRPPRHGCPT